MKKIVIDSDFIKEIANHMRCSDQTVRLALRFITSGEQPDKIREMAIKKYFGVVIEKQDKSLIKLNLKNN